MNKKNLTETDIRTKFITPAIIGENGCKWDLMTQLLEECYFTKDTGPGDVDHLLPEYEKLLAQIAATRAELKAQLQEALTR